MKLNHPISQEIAAAFGHRREQEAPKDGSSTGQSGGSQEKIRLRSKSSANGEVKLDSERSPEEVVVEKNGVLEAKVETRIEARTNSR
jgi:hypothetical protein